MTYQPNTYDDDDMRAVIEEIEKLEAEAVTIKARAAGECSKIAARIKAKRKEAKDELGIPSKVLGPILKRRKLERKIAEITAGVDEDYAEVYEDAAGQFCMFSPVEAGDDVAAEGEKPWPDDAQAGQRTADDDEAEQAEGEAVINGAVH